MILIFFFGSLNFFFFLESRHRWSISLITKSLTGAAVVDVPMGVGDAILFRGQEHPHYRDPYENQSVTSMSMSWDRRSY